MDQTDPELARLIDRVRGARAGRAPLYINGGGTKAFYGEEPVGELLDVTGVRGISCYEPTELVVTARAGTPLEELESALEEQGQCLPFEPPRFARGGTVGGMVSAGLSGPARANAGAVRDHVLGVTLLNGLGEVVSFGGQVAKNVAGYDVSRLMAGSLGILGVICEVSLKVLPAARATSTVCFDWDESRALRQMREWGSQPLPLNASAWCEGRLYVRLAGAVAAVDAACAKLGGEPLAADAAAAWWRSVRDQTREFFCPDPADLARGDALWRLSLPANAGPVRLPGRQFIEWHGAQRWWRTAAHAEEIRTIAVQAAGHATRMRGAAKSGGAFTPVGAALLRVHRALKQSFDPDGVFNRGRLYAEL
jgi:FAD/FMN-containing dehydrogenase